MLQRFRKLVVVACATVLTVGGAAPSLDALAIPSTPHTRHLAHLQHEQHLWHAAVARLNFAAWMAHFNPTLSCIRWAESRDNYQAINPSSGAAGAYQWMHPTWVWTVNDMGWSLLAPASPIYAAPRDQDLAAAHLLERQGTSPWRGDPCVA